MANPSDSKNVFPDNGNVGIGTTSPNRELDVTSEENPGIAITSKAAGASQWALFSLGTARAGNFEIQQTEPGEDKIPFTIEQNAPSHSIFVGKEGHVGIGTPTPNEKLEVRGNVIVTGDVLLSGADCAEDFDVKDGQDLDPGTVMVICDEDKLQQCTQAYDKKVAGVLSGAGKYRPGIILDKKQSQKRRMPLALTGKVFVKVDADRSPVEVGDLLTTSSTPGFAMKALDQVRAFGAVIGKALQPLESGRGLIPVLVTLH